MGNSWNVIRVRSARSYYQLPAFAQNDQPSEVTLQVAARRLNVSQSIVRRMIEEKILPARQVVLCAPWQIAMEALDSKRSAKRPPISRIECGFRNVRVLRVSNQCFQRDSEV